MSIDEAKIGELTRTVAELVARNELPSAQLALAHRGEVVAFETFGRARTRHGELDADASTLYTGFSVIKAVTSSALWVLLEDERLALDDRVVDHLAEFDTNGKDAVRVEHLLTHTAGFPAAPFAASDWDDIDRRHARFRQWRLDWPPGTRFVYHPTATMWVVAALIERCGGMDFRRFIRERVLGPLGLSDMHLGLAPSRDPEAEPHVADLVAVGSPPAPGAAQSYSLPEDLEAPGGFLDVCNSSSYRAVGVPGGGGVMTARALALFYQALLRGGTAPDGKRVWREETIRQASRVHSGELTDPITGRLANRGLGIVIAGDENRVYRSFGTDCSEAAIGHGGMGGQVGWGDPQTGISFAFLTNGFDRDPMRAGVRGVILSSLAAASAAG